MPVDAELLQGHFQDGEYEACVASARRWLGRPGLTPVERTLCYAYMCWSQFQLGEFSAAVESGILAAHLAEETGELNLMGQSLVVVAESYFRQGLLPEAVETLRRAILFISRFKKDKLYLEGKIWANLGVYLRAMGQLDEALTHLKRAAIWWREVDPSKAELVRSYACWIHLLQGDLREAERLLAAGDAYVQAHPDDDEVVTQHLIDKAKYAALIGEPGQAAARAWECVGRSKKFPGARARALLVLAELALQHRKPKVAAELAGLAHFAADEADRPDLVTQVIAFVDQLQLHHAEAVQDAMVAFTGQPPK